MQKVSDKTRLNDDIRSRMESFIKVKTSFQDVVSTAVKHGVTLPQGLEDTLVGIENEYKAFVDRSERKLRIAVAGKFSCGKSQFINSLIGKEIASVDSARTTCCKTIFTGDPSVREVVISDSAGRTYSREEYVQRSAKVSASRKVFTVRLPDADWTAFEVIDTPGYDSIDEEDRQISEEAVADADVVFFLFDMSNGTIPKDSIEYLKRSVSANQRVYLVANKADLKPEGARRTIMNSIASECNRNELKYEYILPYSSLMPWSKEILSKNEVARTNVLKIARQLKVETLDVINKLVERASTIRDAKIAVELKSADGRLADFQELIANVFFTSLGQIWSKKSESSEAAFEALVESVISVLQDSAIESTERNASGFVRWHELKGTGLFVCDWAVYLAKPTTQYDLSDEDKAALSQSLLSVFSEYGFSSAGVVDELIALRKECAIETIDRYRIKDEDAPSSGDDALFFYSAALEHGDYCATCDYESERMGCEKSILSNLNREFPAAFAKLLEEKVSKVMERILIEDSLKPAMNVMFESVKALARFSDSCAEAMNGTIRGDAFIVESLMEMNVLPSPIEGAAFFFVATSEKVEKGQVLGRLVPYTNSNIGFFGISNSAFINVSQTFSNIFPMRDSDAAVSLSAPRSGHVVLLVKNGETVGKFAPLLQILEDD